jgi:hypothetical protein
VRRNPMDISIKIDAVIHIHNPGDLQTEIDKLSKLNTGGEAKTEELKTAVDAAKGKTP